MQEVPNKHTRTYTPTTTVPTEGRLGDTRIGEGRIRDDRSIGDLFRELADETRALVQQEIHLARAEMGQKLDRVTDNATSIGIGGTLALAGLITLCGALSAGVFALMVYLDVPFLVNIWLSPLIVAVIVGAIGYAMVKGGITNLKKERLAPRRTTESLRENKQWMQEKLT